MLGRDEHAIGQVELAQPAIVQPGQLLAIEPGVAQVDRQEVGRPLGLLLEDPELFADVAVDHAEDGRDARPAAEGQRPVRADVAEDEQGPRARAIHDATQPIVEPLGPPPGHGASRAGPPRREPRLQPDRQVVRGMGAHAIGRDLGIVTPEQQPLDPLEPGRGDPTRQASREAAGS